MKIISKANVIFHRPAGADNPAEDFSVGISDLPVNAPEWVAQDDHFKLLLKDGTMVDAATLMGTGRPTSHQLALVDEEELHAEIDRRAKAKAVKPPSEADPDAKRSDSILSANMQAADESRIAAATSAGNLEKKNIADLTATTGGTNVGPGTSTSSSGNHPDVASAAKAVADAKKK